MKSWKGLLHLMKVRKLEIFIAVLLAVGVVSSIKVAMEQRRIEELARIRIEKEAERDKLAELSIKYPDYRDLWYRLAAAQWELGNEEAAKEALIKAKYLDPNNEQLNWYFLSHKQRYSPYPFSSRQF
jgi:hypothetical protein